MNLDGRIDQHAKGFIKGGALIYEREGVKQLIRDVLDYCEPRHSANGPGHHDKMLGEIEYLSRRKELGL